MVERTIEQINEKIRDGSVNVVTAEEMTSLVQELGVEEAARQVDVVTTGTFGAMCSTGVFLNFGHSDPPIKMQKVWLNDVEAYTGLGDAEAMRWNYPSACSAYRHALKIAPGNDVVARSLQLCERVLVLDPSDGLGSEERYRRSRFLLERVLGSLNQCAASHSKTTLSDSLTQLADRARDELATRRKPKSYDAAASELMELSRGLWESWPQACALGSDDALTRVMTHLQLEGMPNDVLR